MTMNPTAAKNDEPDFSEPEPVARHRRDFESWASAPERNCHLKRIEFGPQGGQYYHGYVEFAWRAWLEAATRADREFEQNEQANHG